MRFTLCLGLLILGLFYFPSHSYGFSVIPAGENVQAAEEATTTGVVSDLQDDVTGASINDENVVSDQVQESSDKCEPEFASFGKCYREAIPDHEVIEHPRENEDVGTGYEITQPVRQLLNESNLTAGDSIGNHKIVLGRASCKCGIGSRRIVAGQPASIRDLPWTVALTRGSVFGSGRPFCGGTLINSRYVLTASHCVDGQSASALTVLVNEQDLNQGGEAVTEKYSVSNIIMHQSYNRRNIDNDIALLRLSRPVTLLPNGPVTPACLPASNSNSFAGVIATVAGWGATSQGASTSSVLRRVDVPVISNQVCNTQTKYNNKITDNMLCAGYVDQGGKDSCQGDSGGPLIINNGGRKTLIGIVSWGYGCAQPKSPGVYTRVSRYPEWILANTRDADWCEG